MKYILVLILGLLLGHFGPIYCLKWTAKTSSTVLHTSGKALDTANKMLK